MTVNGIREKSIDKKFLFLFYFNFNFRHSFVKCQGMVVSCEISPLYLKIFTQRIQIKTTGKIKNENIK